MEASITGLSDLQALLDQLPANIEKKVMRGALRAGQKVVLDQARQAVHNVSGDLAQSLRIKTSARGGKVSATVVAGNAKAYYARMVEFGTASHLIKPKKGRALAFGGREYASLRHPGAKKKPFMRPALDAAAGEGSAAFEAVKTYLAARINKELAKLPDETDEVTK